MTAVTGSAGRDDRSLRTGLLVLLALLTLAAYWRLPGNGFIVFDDDIYITGNSLLQQGLTLEGVRWAFQPMNHVSYWQPLVWLSLMLDFQLFGLHPAGYHLVNLGLHCLNALLLFLLLGRVTGRTWPAFLVAALFVVHPLNVESVAWAVERKTVLATLFWMLALLGYERYGRQPSAGRYLAVAAFMALGLMARPTLVALPPVMLLMDFWPLGRCRSWRALGRLVTEKLPLGVLAGMAVAMTMASTRDLGDLVGAPLGERLQNVLVAAVTYLGQMVWPARLTVFYPLPEQYPAWQVAGAGVLLAALTLLAMGGVRRYPWLLFGWGWYLIVSLPTIGLVRAGVWAAHADRYAYLPEIGIFLLAALGTAELAARRPQLARPLAVGWGAALLALTVLTGSQVGQWRDQITLFSHARQVVGDNDVVLGALGDGYFVAGRMAEALACYRRVENPVTYEKIQGRVALERGDLPAAREWLTKAEQRDGSLLDVGFFLGRLDELQGDPDRAMVRYLAVIHAPVADTECLKRQAAAARQRLLPPYLSRIEALRKRTAALPPAAPEHLELAGLMETAGLYDEAAQVYASLERAGMGGVPLLLRIARLETLRGRPAAAATVLERARLQAPGDAVVVNRLGDAYMGVGAFRRAADCYRELVALRGDDFTARYNLVIALLSLRERGAAMTELRQLASRFPEQRDQVAPLLKSLSRFGL